MGELGEAQLGFAEAELEAASEEFQLEEEMGEDVCDSDAELLCAKLHGVDINGGGLAMKQAFDLYRAIKPVKPTVKEECPSGGEDDDHAEISGAASLEQCGVKLKSYRRKACVRDIRYG